MDSSDTDSSEIERIRQTGFLDQPNKIPQLDNSIADQTIMEIGNSNIMDMTVIRDRGFTKDMKMTKLNNKDMIETMNETTYKRMNSDH